MPRPGPGSCPRSPAETTDGPARPYSQRSSGRPGGPAGDARRTRPSWRPAARAGAGSSARWAGWRCCSGCGCSRRPSGRRRSALRGQHRPRLLACPPSRRSARPCGTRRGAPRLFSRARIQSTTRTGRLQRAPCRPRDGARARDRTSPSLERPHAHAAGRTATATHATRPLVTEPLSEGGVAAGSVRGGRWEARRRERPGLVTAGRAVRRGASWGRHPPP